MQTSAGSEAVGRMLQDAVRYHQSGRIGDAEALYEQILAEQRDHFDALHLYAVCRHQRGDFAAAEKHLRKALQLRPNVAQAHLSYGNALRELQKLPDAIASYTRAVAIDPKLAIAHYNLGTAWEEAGRHEQALASYERALGLHSDANALAGRANCLVALGRLQEAEQGYRAAAALDPTHAIAHANLGSVLMQLGRFDEALAVLERALALHPGDNGALLNRAIALNEMLRPLDALTATDHALILAGGRANADLLHQRARSLADLGRREEARQLLQQVLTLQPSHWEARFDLAALWIAGEHPDEVDAALRVFDALVAERPGEWRVPYNRGQYLFNQGRFAEARAVFESLGEANGAQSPAAFSLGLLDLLEGRFESGWPGYEQRFHDPTNKQPPRKFAQSAWLGGTEVSGATLLVHADQGFGDTLQMTRYLPALATRAGRVIFEVQEAVARLVRRSLPNRIEVVAAGTPLPPFDRHCPLLSVPFAMGTTLDSVPAEVPYLSTDPARVDVWRDRLGSGRRARVGLVWSGNPNHRKDRQRSIGLATLRHLIEPFSQGPRRVDFIALQNNLREADREPLAQMPTVQYFGEAIEDFDDCAALVELCDLVISVDSAAIHVAGALGKPVWALLSFVPDWRWMLERSDSPWYPTARLFRQSKLGQWNDVVAAVESELGGFLARQGAA